MNFVTDRTEADVLLKNEKGRYDYTDLNRVEQDVQELMELANQSGFSFDLKTKTDWARPGKFSPETWPTESQMKRYLDNVWALVNEFLKSPIYYSGTLQSPNIAIAAKTTPDLPTTMQNLTWDGANQIEKALDLVHFRIRGIIDNWRYAGEIFSGDDGL